jgi:hypothetical protein
MDRKYFIEGIKTEVRDSSVSSMLKKLLAPAGRNPRKSDLELSNFFNGISEESKNNIEKIIANSVDFAVFGFLCVLDHVRFLEDIGEKTTFELYAVKNNERILLNDFSKEDLHDLYNEIVQE